MTATPFFAGPHYLVTPDGTHCYPVDRSKIVTRGAGGSHYMTSLVLPDEVRTVDQKLGSGYHDPQVCWVISPRPLSKIVVKGRDMTETIGWILKDPDAASEKYPVRLTTAEWDARGYDDEETEDGYLAQRIYRKETRTVPGEDVHHSTADLTRLDGEPDANPGRSWTADQPMNLVYSWNYHHLFPGRMGGVRQAVVDALREAGVGSVKVWDHLPNDPVEVTITVRHQTPQWRTVQQTGRNGRALKATKQVPVTIQVPLRIPLSSGAFVAGATKADAAATFDRIVTEWVEWVKSYQVVACDHCDGTGVAHRQNERPDSGKAERRGA